MEKVYDHPTLGKIRIVKRAFSRNIRLTVHPRRGITVSIPWLTTFSTAEKFVREKEEWVLTSLKRQKKRAEEHRFSYGADSPLQIIGKEIRFVIADPGSGNAVRIKRGPEYDLVIYPADCPEATIAEAVTRILRKEAAGYLPERTAQLASLHGFQYSRLTLKNNKTNWGSCSGKNNINLNIHLMRLGTELADFVILHELCHLRHRNHGPEFHKLLNNLSGGREKEFNSKLRKVRPVAILCPE